jgi:hypothetical protein
VLSVKENDQGACEYDLFVYLLIWCSTECYETEVDDLPSAMSQNGERACEYELFVGGIYPLSSAMRLM